MLAEEPAQIDAVPLRIAVGRAVTEKLLLVPLSLDPVFAAVRVKLPALEIVTLWFDKTPAVNAAVVPLPEVIVPVDEISTVPINEVTVLLFTSWAVIVAMANPVSAI
jgi:hypothetical protein